MAQERLTIDDLLTPFGKVIVLLFIVLLVIYLVLVQFHLVKLDNKIDFLERANVPTAVVSPTVASPSATVAPTASPSAKLTPTKTLLRGITSAPVLTVAPTVAVKK